MNDSAAALTQSTDFLKKTFRAAVVPGIISFFSSNMALLADTVLVGRFVGVDGLASVSVCAPVILIISLVGGFLSCGAETLCSKAIGKNDVEYAQRIYGAQISLALAFSAAFMLVGLFAIRPIASTLCGGDPALIPMAADYSRVYLLAAAASMLTFPPFWFLPLDGKNRSVIVMMLIMGLGNVALDIWFLCGLHLGVHGAALASVISAGASALYGMIRLHTGKETFSLRLSLPRGGEWMELFTAGSPEAFTNLFQALRVLAVNGILHRVGGNVMVARFAVVNALAAIAEAVTVGVPQSGTAIMGVYCGEKDNPSVLILLRQQLGVGLAGCAVMMLLFGLGAPAISWAYQVDGLGAPLWFLGLSLFPVLLVNILTYYYRVAGWEMLSNCLIVLRTFVFCVLSLLALKAVGATPWLFLVTEGLLTLAAWAGLTGVLSRRKPNQASSRWLLMDKRLEDNGNSINFSTPSDEMAICDATDRISTFCAANKMEPKQVMRVRLALEEMMVLITQFNPGDALSFDVRVFAVMGVIGIRIRYGGIDFNPLSPEYAEDERFLGVQMVRSLVEETVYQSTFGVNSLMILIE